MMKFFRICDHTFEGCDHKSVGEALDSSGAENLFKIPNVVTLARAVLAKPVTMVPPPDQRDDQIVSAPPDRKTGLIPF